MFHETERPLYEIKANLFKGLAHPYRIRVLEILSACDEASVGEIASLTGLEQSHLSQHLSVLRRNGLVTSERRASVVFYRLAHPEVADLLRVARTLLFNTIGGAIAQQSALDALPEIPHATPGDQKS